MRNVCRSVSYPGCDLSLVSEGVRHSGEITSSETVLWMTKYLIENYGKDPAITELIDSKTIYLRPVNNPDGVNLYMHTAQRNRSTVRPDDNDGDGLFDEDPEEDLDGDGVIYQMRRKAKPDELDKANYIIDPRDPSGQLMQRVLEGKGDWFIYTEGIDNDGVETRSVVLWLLSHPNVSVVNSMDTRVPMHLRPPSTSRGSESMFPEDLVIYERLDELGISYTGYPWAGDVYESYATRSKVNRLTGSQNAPPAELEQWAKNQEDRVMLEIDRQRIYGCGRE